MILTRVSDAVNSASSAPSANATESTDTGKGNILINPEVFDLFNPPKPQRPTLPPPPQIAAPTPAATPKDVRPQPLINPDVASAFAEAGMRPARGTLAERAALHLTRVLRDMVQGKASSPDEVPFYEPIAAAYASSQSAAMNAACQGKVNAIGATLESALAEHTDAAKARSVAAKAQPFVSWDKSENSWVINLYSGDFINAVWDVGGGRTANNAPAFDALMQQLQEAARQPIISQLEASEERFYDLVDRVMAIIVETQQRAAWRARNPE